MARVRHAAVAGMFYSGNPRELDAAVRGYLAEAAEKAPQGPVPKAITAPHAGYVYSGPIAATAYARLKPAAGTVRRVILLGPCHRVAVRGLAAPSAEAFATPLGSVPVDRAAVDSILGLQQVEVFDATHTDEHSLEVHLPFLQELFEQFTLVPLVVGQASAEEVAEVLERLWGGSETVIVISSDLSHYLDYESAQRSDAATCKAIEALDPGAIDRDQACGRVPVNGLLTLAKQRGLRVETLDLRNSGDTAGDRSRVVGYGAWMFVEPGSESGRQHAEEPESVDAVLERTQDVLNRHGETILHIAAASIEHGLAYGAPLAVDTAKYPDDLRASGACFVTLTREGRLRGCVGSPEARRPLVEDVADNGFAAAFRDSRFDNLTDAERDGLLLSVSVLSPSIPMAFTDEGDFLGQLRPNEDGLIIADEGRRALFLPQVWESLPGTEDFVSQLKAKAGLARDHWSGTFQAWRFGARSVSSTSLEDPALLWT